MVKNITTRTTKRGKPLTEADIINFVAAKDKSFVSYYPESPNRGVKKIYSHYIIFMGEKSVLTRIFWRTSEFEYSENIILECGEKDSRDNVYYEAIKRLPDEKHAQFRWHWDKAKTANYLARTYIGLKTPMAKKCRPDAVKANGELIEIKTDNWKKCNFTKDGAGFVRGMYEYTEKVNNVEINFSKKEKEILDLGYYHLSNPNKILVDKLNKLMLSTPGEQKISLDLVAKKCGFSDSSIVSRHLKGEREISREHAIAYARFFGCDPSDILFSKPLIKIWGHVDFYKTNEADVSYGPAEIMPQAQTDYIECPRDLYRPDIKAIRVKSNGSYFNEQVLFYYNSNTVDFNTLTNKFCIVGVKTEIFDETYYKYYAGLLESFHGDITLNNPDPFAKTKVILNNPQNIFFTAAVVSAVDFHSLKTDSQNKEIYEKMTVIKEATAQAEEILNKQNEIRLAKEKNLNDKIKKLQDDMNKLIKEINSRKSKDSKEIPVLGDWTVVGKKTA